MFLAPKIFWGDQKNFRVQKHVKFSRFRSTLKFDSEYLRDGKRYSISVKYLIYRDSFGVG